MAMIKFKVITPDEAYKYYREGVDDAGGRRGEWGEVKIPGHGWRLCFLKSQQDMTPTHFYDEDDGWNPVPKVEFERV